MSSQCSTIRRDFSYSPRDLLSIGQYSKSKQSKLCSATLNSLLKFHIYRVNHCKNDFFHIVIRNITYDQRLHSLRSNVSDHFRVQSRDIHVVKINYLENFAHLILKTNNLFPIKSFFENDLPADWQICNHKNFNLHKQKQNISRRNVSCMIQIVTNSQTQTYFDVNIDTDTLASSAVSCAVDGVNHQFDVSNILPQSLHNSSTDGATRELGDFSSVQNESIVDSFNLSIDGVGELSELLSSQNSLLMQMNENAAENSLNLSTITHISPTIAYDNVNDNSNICQNGHITSLNY